jgi:DHA1 family bicyclomycin/chloramphenicol resistance-like MFS transporter
MMNPRTLQPDTAGMTIMLSLLTALGPLSTDMYLPSLPAIQAAFGTDGVGTQLTLSAYLVGFAVGQIFYGPISDKLGRKPAVLTGLALYCFASAMCALAPTIEWLIGARFLQALGAAGPIVLGRAMVRDLYDGARAGKELSRMGMIMGLVPAVAPALGGILEVAFGWRSNFWSALAAASVLATATLLLLPETLKQARPEPLSIPGIFRGFGTLLQNPAYRAYIGLSGFTYAGLFAFISGSSFVLQNNYGLSPFAFGLSFGLSVIGFISGTIVAQRVVGRLGLDGTIAIGVGCLATGGVSMLVLMMLVKTGSSLEVTLPQALYAAGVGLVLPQANAGAMMPFPDRAGAASSLQGLSQMTFAAAVGVGLGAVLNTQPLAMPTVITFMGLAATLVFSMTRQARAKGRHGLR